MMTEEETRSEILRIRTSPKSVERKRQYWSEAENKELTALFYQGIGISEIALLLKRSERTVVMKCNELRLYGSQNTKRYNTSTPKCHECPCYDDPAQCHLSKGENYYV